MRPLPYGSGKGAVGKNGHLRRPASMRPLPYGSGKPCGGATVRVRRSASMRPLPYGSGKEFHRCGYCAGQRASMRPLPYGSGKGRPGRAFRRKFSSFNEAAPLRKRKGGWQRPWARNFPAGFNEAAPLRKRKAGSTARAQNRDSVASMRPLPYGSGKCGRPPLTPAWEEPLQ